MLCNGLVFRAGEDWKEPTVMRRVTFVITVKVLGYRKNKILSFPCCGIPTEVMRKAFPAGINSTLK